MYFLRKLCVESSLVWKKGLEPDKRRVFFQKNKANIPLDKVKGLKKCVLSL